MDRRKHSGVGLWQVLGKPLPLLLESLQDVWTCDEGEFDFQAF